MKISNQFVKFRSSNTATLMRKLSLSLGLLLVGLVVGTNFGYHLVNTEKFPVSTVHNLDYFVSDESFSEVHNAKAVLAGLSRRFLTELRIKGWVDPQNDPKHSGSN